MALAILAPLVVAAPCDSDHEVECATDCTCDCHVGPSYMCLDPAITLTVVNSERAGATDLLCRERLSVADIYRPPTSA